MPHAGGTLDKYVVHNLMKDKLVAGGVSGRDPAADDDDYRIQSKLRDTLV